MNYDSRNYPRKEPGYRDIKERLSDYDEVEKSLSEEEIKTQASRCLDCGTPFCHGYACPLGNLIPETNQLVKEGLYKDALELLTSTHQFPEFTARICPALCEGSCVLSINEEAVTIRQIEKMIVEKGYEQGWIKPRIPLKRHKEHLAVIGSGPAGLAAADCLNQKGYNVTVYEKNAHPGGLLLYGIPNFKLDKKIVRRRINLMKEEGITFECDVKVGVDISFNYLKKRFTAVILAGGTQQPRDLDIPGRSLKGIYFATEYLKAQNREIINETGGVPEELNASGKNVTIIGGGDTGSDCIGTALRQGAKKVYQLEIMPRFPLCRSDHNPWPEWPRIDRISSSHQEGGFRYWSVRTTSFEGNKKGEVKKLHCIEVDWINEKGKYIPVDSKNSSFIIEAELVLLAMGFLGPGPDPFADMLRLERAINGSIKIDEKHMTSVPGIFSAGDMARGQSLVVRAIADGKAAAEDIDNIITSGSMALLKGYR